MRRPAKNLVLFKTGVASREGGEKCDSAKRRDPIEFLCARLRVFATSDANFDGNIVLNFTAVFKFNLLIAGAYDIYRDQRPTQRNNLFISVCAYMHISLAAPIDFNGIHGERFPL